jgi:hypothetical protein
MSKFKVGDRVRRAKKAIFPEIHGVLDRTYTVVNDDIAGVTLDGVECPVDPSCIELVQPASPSPVITKTVKEIVPGKYGRIEVVGAESRVDCDIPRVFIEGIGWFNASDLRDASRIFLELADALDEQ